MRFMMAVSPAAAIGRACSGAPCLITYQSGPIRMEARLREIQRERKGKAEADAQQNCFTSAHTRALSIPRSGHRRRGVAPPKPELPNELVAMKCSPTRPGTLRPTSNAWRRVPTWRRRELRRETKMLAMRRTVVAMVLLAASVFGGPSGQQELDDSSAAGQS